MKKRVIGLILGLAALVFMLSSTAWAVDYQAEYTPNSGTTQRGTFKDMWNLAAKNSGTVKLLQDVTADSSGSFGTGDGFTENGAVTVPIYATIMLDLNGKTLDRGLSEAIENGFVIAVDQTLTIQDNSTDGKGTITGGYTTENGGGVFVSDYGSLSMYAGNIANNYAKNGGGVCVASGGIFNLHGGKICENHAASTDSIGGNGGGVYLDDIYGNKRKSVLNFYSGEISDNTSSLDGGGICNNEGTVTMSGGSIVRNTSRQNGGGIKTFSTLKISGGLIANNTAQQYGGGVLFGGSNPPPEYAISGNPQIIDNKVGYAVNNVQVASEPKITIGELADGATIGISARLSDTTPEFQISNSDNDGEKYLKYFFADDSENCHVAWDATGNYIKLVKGPVLHEHVLNVGCDDTITDTDPVTFKKKLSTNADGKLCVDGTPITAVDAEVSSVTFSRYSLDVDNYYLTDDLVLDKPIALSNSGTFNLCLNGHTIKFKDSQPYSVIYLLGSSTRLNLVDCSSACSGLITGGKATTTDISNGGGIYVGAGTLNIYGGKISGNNSNGLGGGVYNAGTLNMFGGEISNNKSLASGAGVYSCGSFTMYGGEITKNTTSSWGGGLYFLKSQNNIIAGGLIAENIGRSGGAGLCIDGEATVRMTGGRIENNTTERHGGGIEIFMMGKLYLSGGEITGNKIDSTTPYLYGAGIHLTSSSLSISGAPKVYDNTKNGKLNNIDLIDNSQHNSVIGLESGKTLAAGARIGVTAPVGKITGAGFQSTDVKYFFADDSENAHIGWNTTGKYLEYLSGPAPHTHNNITFTTKLSAISSPLSPGSYYLTGDITLSDTVTISGTANICLNGHTITGPTGKPAFTVPSGATLNIYNEEGTNGFAGLSGSGGIEVAGGGRLNLVAKKAADNVTYAPAAGSDGGTVTVGQDGTVTKPSEGGGEDPTPDGPHAQRHPALAGATAIDAENFASVTQAQKPSDYNGVLPQELTAYRFLNQGKYYLENDFKMPYALIALGDTDFCLNGSNLGADNDTWIYEMQHVFWVPEQAALNVLDCQRDLHIVWLYGGRVFLKNGALVSISGNLPGYITTIEMDEDAAAEGEVQVKYVNNEPVMTLPEGATLTQEVPGKPDQIIINRNGVLEMTTSEGDAPTTKIVPPGTGDTSINLKLPAAASVGETPAIVLEAPMGSTVQTGSGPEIKLEQPGEVAVGGTVSSPKVTVTTADPATQDEVTTTVTAPAGENVQVDAAGQAQAPEGSTVTVDNVAVKLEEIGGSDPDRAVAVSPSGEIVLPAGSEVTAGNPKKDNVSIVIALPEDGGTLSITDNGITPPSGSDVSAKTRESVEIVIALPNSGGDGQPEIKFGDSGSLILPPETKLTVKPKESVTIVIALPNPGDGGQPEIKFGGGGSLILPPGTEVTKGGKKETVTEGNNILDPESGNLNGPVNPNTPTGTPVEVTPDAPISTPDAKIEMNDQGDITVTPTDPQKPPVIIKPQPQNPGDPPAQSPVVDDNGKVFIDEPFKVETEDGPDITAEEGGSVDPDGNVTGKTVTVEQKKPDGTPESNTTLTAPEGDAIKVGSDGGAQAPVGTEVKQDDVIVKIDKVPDPTKPVPVKPDGGIDLPGGSKITVTPEDPQQPDQKYTVTIPEQGGEVKPNPDKTITLPPGAKVVDQDGKETTISSNGGTIDLSTGEITGAASSGGGSSGGSSGGGSSASYVITASASIGGEISPDKQVTVSRGASQTFIIKPAEGYVISNVLVDGKGVGQVTRYTFSNVQSKHTIQALFVAKGMSGHGHQGDCPKDKTCPIWPYTDSIPTAWYHDGVHYCIETDLMIGTAPTLWEPDIPLTRAMMAQVLYNKSGRPAVSGDGMFDDVGQEWYWSAITWGGRNSVLFGYGDGDYGPQDPITREQLVVLLWRYAGRPQTDVQSSFSDVAEVSDYAKQALHWASQHGIIAGYPDGAFHPHANATRAEAAQMIMRYFNL